MKLIHIPVAVGLALASASALAGPHFLKADGWVDGDGNYVASWKEAGLGNQPVTYMLSAASESFTYQCYTRSGNTPQGAPNSQRFSNDSTLATFYPTRNGQISGSMMMTPEKGNASCQGGGLKLCLIAVSYQTVTLTDTNNNIVATLPTISVSLGKPDCS